MSEAAKTLPNRTVELLTMLQYKRPSGGATEAQFIKRFILPLGVTKDKMGNIWCRIDSDDCPILWSCHTDTVHNTEGKQHIIFGDGIATSDSGECLGADCTTGVWLMVNMIRAGIPGLYLFHAAEEVGGVGSDYIAQKMQHKLKHIKYAVAFDRKGTDEIITHQGWRRTASNAFANSLADALSLPLDPSDRGTFTDTANYADLIPECCNVSVGYYKQHTKHEYQDVDFANKLLDSILAADFSRLVCERDPAVDDDEWTYPEHWGAWRDHKSDVGQRPKGLFGDDMPDCTFASLFDYVKKYPRDVADFLEINGYTIEEIEQQIWGQTSVYGASSK